MPAQTADSQPAARRCPRAPVERASWGGGPEHGPATPKGETLRTICLLLMLALALTSLAGCGHHDASAASGTPQAAAAGAGAGDAESIGVPECDAYLKKYMDCIASKVPAVARTQYRNAFDQTLQSWRQAASTPEGKAGLALGCKQAQAASEQAMKVYGCTF